MIENLPLSNSLHLFICPLHTENDPNARNDVRELDPSAWTASQASTRVRLPVQVDESILLNAMAVDIAGDFNRFLDKYLGNLSKNVASHIGRIKTNITDSLIKNCTVFSKESIWFHISQVQESKLDKFCDRFHRADEKNLPGIVFGYFHEKNFYRDAILAKAKSEAKIPAHRPYRKDTEARSAYREKIKNLIKLKRNLEVFLARNFMLKSLIEFIDFNFNQIDLAYPYGSINDAIPGLEVSLRMPIKTPEIKEYADFEKGIESIRKELRQYTIGIFAQDQGKMYYWNSRGEWSEGAVKFIRPDGHNEAQSMDKSESFLASTKRKIQYSATINEDQRPSVHDRQRPGVVIPANVSYLESLTTSQHLGFSYFPASENTGGELNNLFMLDGGRWLWNAVFPYCTDGVSQRDSFVLMDTTPAPHAHAGLPIHVAKYARYQSSNCSCGRSFPRRHDPTSCRNGPLGKLRMACPPNGTNYNAGNPRLVLENRNSLLSQRQHSVIARSFRRRYFARRNAQPLDAMSAERFLRKRLLALRNARTRLPRVLAGRMWESANSVIS